MESHMNFSIIKERGYFSNTNSKTSQKSKPKFSLSYVRSSVEKKKRFQLRVISAANQTVSDCFKSQSTSAATIGNNR